MKICADTIPEIHDFSAAKVLRPSLNPIDADQMTEPIAVDQSMQ